MHAYGEVTKMAEATSTTMTFCMGGEAMEKQKVFLVKYNLAVSMHEDLELWLRTLAHHGSIKLRHTKQCISALRYAIVVYIVLLGYKCY
jgi:type II secretory pathway component PulF